MRTIAQRLALLLQLGLHDVLQVVRAGLGAKVDDVAGVLAVRVVRVQDRAQEVDGDDRLAHAGVAGEQHVAV